VIIVRKQKILQTVSTDHRVGIVNQIYASMALMSSRYSSLTIVLLRLPVTGIL